MDGDGDGVACENPARSAGAGDNRGSSTPSRYAGRADNTPANSVLVPSPSSIPDGRFNRDRSPAGSAPATLMGEASSMTEIVGFAAVVDGDTLRINGLPVRLFGMDSFEAHQRCVSAGRESTECGQQATIELGRLVAGREVRCTPRSADSYNRTVATCLVGSTDLAREMIRRGLAVALPQYSLNYLDVERSAREARSGAYAGTFETPSAYRAGRQAAQPSAPAAILPSTQCQIRGNINNRGEQIYHLPTNRDWAKVRAEQLFCSEEDAIRAGFRPAGN